MQPRASEEYSPDDALKVSTQAVEILFGSTRTAVLRVGDIPLVMERQREYKVLSAQAKDLRSQGKAVPRDFCLDTFFFTFQHQRDTILAKAPISVRDVGQVAWMSSKYSTRPIRVNERTNGSSARLPGRRGLGPRRRVGGS